MRCLALSLCLFALLPATASAGPWPREPGEVFTAVTGTYRYAPEIDRIGSDGGVYLEYGLSDRVTLGFDAMDDPDGYSHAYGFLRWPLPDRDRALKLAFHLGAGASRQGQDWGRMTRLGLNMGRSTAFLRPGWWTLTAALEDHALLDAPVYKLDATVGLQLLPRLKAFLDVETSQSAHTPDSVTLRGSVAWQSGPGTHFTLGIETRKSDARFFGLRLGLWRAF